jgi:hypothetical protein
MEIELNLSNDDCTLNCGDYMVQQSNKILELKDIFKQKIKKLEAEIFYQYGVVTGNRFLVLLIVLIVF